MKVTVGFSGLARAAAGRPSEEIELDSTADVRQLLAEIARRHGQPMQSLVDPGPLGVPAVLVFVGGAQVAWQTPSRLKNGDDVMILSPISGG
jgi:molybdopterin converting factor small subunit